MAKKKKKKESRLKFRKPDWKKLKRLAVPCCALLLLLFFVSFAASKHQELSCGSIKVNIKDEDQRRFLSEEMVKYYATDGYAEKVVGEKTDRLNLATIESRIRKNPFVKDVQAWLDMQGNLHLDLLQRRPVIRVVSPDNSAYYLDEEGKRMELSKHYTAFVPMATASYSAVLNDSLQRSLDSNLFVLAQALEKDSFVNALAGQIVIEPENEFTLIPRMGQLEIALGDLTSLDDKFLRLRSFYRSALPQAGWNTYKKISLKYNNQVIAKR